jgi:hypothetical protein
LTISVKRPLGRTSIAVGVGRVSLAASAAVMVAGTGAVLRLRHQATAFSRA